MPTTRMPATEGESTLTGPRLFSPGQDAPSHRDAKGKKAVVILVHGTFAGHADDKGDRWWQCNSRAANQLQSKIPAGVSIAQDSEVFHWSGENSERARNKAAFDLLRHIEVQEESGLDYHLVGHSHGGSVIWNALRIATLHRKDLKHLKSWTTVGTPYLQHKGRGALDPMNVIGVLLGVLLLPVAFRALRSLINVGVSVLTGSSQALTLPRDDQIGYIAIMRAPVLSALEWMGVRIEKSSLGIHIGSYNPDSGQSMFSYFFGTPEGLLLICTILLSMYFFLQLSMMCIRPVVESHRLRAEARLQVRTFQLYGFRSLSIWSPDDEAINGLRATLNISVSFVRKLMPTERVFASDALSLVSRPYYWIFSPFYNHWIQPWLDRSVRTIVVRSAQGNDRPTATIIAVTPSPVREINECVPPLPERLCKRILAVADHHARDIAPLLRALLGSASFSSGLELFCKSLSGKELVHTSYFDHAEILDLIACNITLETDVDSMQSHLGRMNPDLVDWFASVKTQLQHESSVDIVANRHLPLRRAA